MKKQKNLCPRCFQENCIAGCIGKRKKYEDGFVFDLLAFFYLFIFTQTLALAMSAIIYIFDGFIIKIFWAFTDIWQACALLALIISCLALGQVKKKIA